MTATHVSKAPAPEKAPERRDRARSWLATMRRRRVLAPVLAGALVLVLVIVWLVAFSSVFGVRSVQVRGLRTLTSARVESSADVAHGTPLVRVDAASVASRVERIPEVASAKVGTSFPSTLVITVVERTPVGFVREDGAYRLIDHTGDAYRSVTSRPPHVPQMVMSDEPSTRRAVAGVAAALVGLPAKSRPEIESIQALAPNAITVVLAHGRIVHWGTAGRSVDKARVLPIMLQKKSADQFDVSDPDRPFSS